MHFAHLITFGAVVTSVSGLPAPELKGVALERALARLNAPEPWQKRDVQAQATSTDKRQFMIGAYEELDDTISKGKRQSINDAYEELGDTVS